MIEDILDEFNMMQPFYDGMPGLKFFKEGFWQIRETLHRLEEGGGNVGSAEALVTLGDSYRHGTNGMPQDDRKAVQCYMRGAAVDSVQCTLRLGVCLFEGRGIEQNYEHAFMYLCRDSDVDPEVARCRGLCLLNGWGTEQDYEEAISDLKYAAREGKAEGDAEAAYHLGGCYEEGKGVEANREKAAEWYARAAEKGLAKAADRLQALQK